jgi:hypothetical protein
LMLKMEYLVDFNEDSKLGFQIGVQVGFQVDSSKEPPC